MSRNRIKNISYGGDDDYVDDDDYGEENELSPEDREQMRLRTAEVQELLRSEIPPIQAQEEEIWGSLWHYYYDVDKTVSYLRSKFRYRFALSSVLCRADFYFNIEKYRDPAPKKTLKQQATGSAAVQGKTKGKGKFAIRSFLYQCI